MILVRLLLMQAAQQMPGIFGETELTWAGFFAGVVEVGVLGTAVGGLSAWVLLRLKRVCLGGD